MPPYSLDAMLGKVARCMTRGYPSWRHKVRLPTISRSSCRSSCKVRSDAILVLCAVIFTMLFQVFLGLPSLPLPMDHSNTRASPSLLHNHLTMCNFFNIFQLFYSLLDSNPPLPRCPVHCVLLHNLCHLCISSLHLSFLTFAVPCCVFHPAAASTPFFITLGSSLCTTCPNHCSLVFLKFIC